MFIEQPLALPGSVQDSLGKSLVLIFCKLSSEMVKNSRAKEKKSYFGICIWSGITRMNIPIQTCHFFFKYSETSISLVKFRTAMCGGLLGISKKNIFFFKTRQKVVTKLGQFTKIGPFSTFQLFKLSKLCYNFLLRFENVNNFFLIPSYSPPIAVWNSLTNQFYQKKNMFLYIFKKQKKIQF